MAVSCSTLLAQTFTDQQGDWTSATLDTSTITELTIDINLTSLTAQTTITLSRVDAFNNTYALWGAAFDPGNIYPLAADVGPSSAYSSTATFGAKVQMHIRTTGTVNGTISLQGKG